MKKNDTFRTVLIVISILLTIILGVAFVQLIRANQRMEQLLKYGNLNTKEYSKHYVLIVDNPESAATEALLKGCQTSGELKDAYVELFESDLTKDYSRLGLINLAIEMGVDGIILEGEEDKELSEMIGLARSGGIPVVTVEQDCMDSDRISYVGIGAYDLGREYGREIIRNAQKSDEQVLIFMNKDADDSTQNIIYNGIYETLRNEGNHLKLELVIEAVNEQSYFTADESIRSYLTNADSLPDFVVCLSEQDTLIMANAVVDYNIVGKLNVLGYDASDNILEGIEKEIITATVALDYELMGETCVNALSEFNTTGNVNGYFLMDVHTINSINIKEYAEREKD